MTQPGMATTMKEVSGMTTQQAGPAPALDDNTQQGHPPPL